MYTLGWRTFVLVPSSSTIAISVVLIREEGCVQLLIHDIIYSMVVAKSRYPNIEKLALAFLVAL